MSRSLEVLSVIGLSMLLIAPPARAALVARGPLIVDMDSSVGRT
jgi:hypothetical protein